MRPGLGSSWCSDSLEAQACRPCKTGQFFATWDILGRVPLKNQVLPPDTGKGVLKESGPANTIFFLSWCFDSLETQACRPCKTCQFFIVWGIFGEGAIKESGPTSGHDGFRWIF